LLQSNGIQYVLIIWGGLQWILILLFVPETYAPVLLRKKAVKLRGETGDDRVSWSWLKQKLITLTSIPVESSNRGHGPLYHKDRAVVLHSTIPASLLRFVSQRAGRTGPSLVARPLTATIPQTYADYHTFPIEPMVLNLCLLSAVLLGILYLFFGVSCPFRQSHQAETANARSRHLP
jgi:hypothetical protein